ncbi:FkbM family methyltransferase [Gymnodinialimonas hymeniacidonis]|uniref:FkbM family methyltransferase n=1 Tax=Gymnodinialimonas hymeniacidonis TaxID=3126508 RepID=UPI0034C5B371
MADPFRNIRRASHIMVGTKRFQHRGVTLHTGPSDIPETVRGHIFKGRYESVEAELVQAILRPNDRVLEVGTGIGFVSILCAKIAGEGQVTSYEANPALEGCILANYSANNLTPDLRMKAVTVDGRPISFFQDPNILSSSLINRDLPLDEITVESHAMESVLNDIRPDVIVMDVEGAEIDLLTTADLSGVRAMIVEVHPHIVGEDKISFMNTALSAAGFEIKARRHKTVHYARKNA